MSSKRGRAATAKRPIKKRRPKRRTAAAETPAAAETLPAVIPQRGTRITDAQRSFALHYISNGFNAAAAYRAAHPGVTEQTSRVEGCRTLAIPNVRHVLGELMEKQWTALQMDAEETLGRAARAARLDWRDVVTETGQIRPVHEWPDAFEAAVDGIEFHPRGAVKKVKLVSRIAVFRLLLEVAGRLRSGAAESVDALAEAIRADISRRAGK